MSQLFDKYKPEFIDIPDNQYGFLCINPEYKDVVILNADNEHTFKLPYEFKELKKIEITYAQGTEIKLVKVFDMNKFVPDNDFNNFLQEDDITTLNIDESINPNKGIKIYNYIDGGAKLFELDKDSVNAQLKLLATENNLDYPVYSILYYNLTPNDVKLFNSYNNQVLVQMKLWVDILNDDLNETKIEFSDKFKIKIKDNLDNECVNITNMEE